MLGVVAGRDVRGLDEGDVLEVADEVPGTEAPCCRVECSVWGLAVRAKPAAVDAPSSPVTIAATASGRCQMRRRGARSPGHRGRSPARGAVWGGTDGWGGSDGFAATVTVGDTGAAGTPLPGVRPGTVPACDDVARSGT